jgi:hypothetical protein
MLPVEPAPTRLDAEQYFVLPELSLSVDVMLPRR